MINKSLTYSYPLTAILKRIRVRLKWHTKSRPILANETSILIEMFRLCQNYLRLINWSEKG